jgi:hypothetical protein
MMPKRTEIFDSEDQDNNNNDYFFLNFFFWKTGVADLPKFTPVRSKQHDNIGVTAP